MSFFDLSVFWEKNSLGAVGRKLKTDVGWGVSACAASRAVVGLVSTGKITDERELQGSCRVEMSSDMKASQV